MACPGSALTTKPDLGRFVFYKLLVLVPVTAAVVAIGRYSSALYWPFVYVGLCLLHAGIMFSIKCPHCAYYKMSGEKLRCFMWWGVPKIYRPRAGPERPYVSVYAPIGMLVLTLFPVYWLAFQWELLVIYLVSIAVIVLSIGQTECPRCLNFDCPHNSVPEEVRREYRATPS